VRLKSGFKKLFRKIFVLFLFHKIFRFINRDNICILMYHGFYEKIEGNFHEYANGKHMRKEKFKSQMAYLKKHYNVISLRQLIDHLTTGEQLPDYAVVITIDDGYKSNYTVAYPIVKNLDMHITVFLTTSFIEKEEFLWTDRVEYTVARAVPKCYSLKSGETELFLDLRDYRAKKECIAEIKSELKTLQLEKREETVAGLEKCVGQKLSNDGDIPAVFQPLEWEDIIHMVKSGLVSIGNHTHRHGSLARCTSEHMSEELELCQNKLETQVGTYDRLFSYPNGKCGDFNLSTKRLLKESGYLCGLTTIGGFDRRGADVYELKRIAATDKDDMDEFIMRLVGFNRIYMSLKQKYALLSKALRG